MALSIKLSKTPLDISSCLKFVNGSQPGSQYVAQAVLTNHSSSNKVIELDFKDFENESFLRMTQIAQESLRRYRLPKAIIHHRTGVVQPNEDLIYLAFAGSDASMAYQACERAISKICDFFPMWQKDDFEITQVGLAAQAG